MDSVLNGEKCSCSCEELKINVTLEEEAVLPEYKTSGSAGMDLYSYEDIDLYPLIPAVVRTGIRMSIPYGYEGQVRARSGLALEGITVVNSPGTIDSDFRGEIGVILLWITALDPIMSSYKVRKGDRIAQLVISKTARAALIPSLFLNETTRGENGYGSTGK